MAETARLDDLADSLPPPAEAADVRGHDVGGADAGAAPEPKVDPDYTPEPAYSPPDDADPLDRLLREYDERNGAGNGAAPDPAGHTPDELARLLDLDGQDAAREAARLQELQTERERFANDSAQSAMAIAQRDRELGELQQTVGSLQQAIQQEVWRQHQQKSREDFEKMAAGEQAKLEGLDLGEDHVKRWMLSEAAQDPELQRAWEAKYYTPPGPVERANIASQIQQWGEGQAKLALQLPSPLARRMAQQNIEASMRQMWETAFPDPAAYRANAAQYVQRALDRMHREARKPRLDPDRSADYFAVAAAVRGASGKPPPEPPVNLGRMTQGEFARHTMEKYGF